MGRIGGPQVNVEADFAFIEVETYHSAVRQEVGGLSYRKHRQPSKTLHDRVLASCLVAAKEQDVAVRDLLQLIYQTDVVNPSSDELALDGVLELPTTRLVIKDAELDGCVPSVQGTCRPVDKLREVK